MCLSTYCKIICHIYFNYHFGESTSRWVNSKFTRHIQFSLRMVIAFSLAAFIAYGTGLKDHLTFKFMIPGMTILTINETFGLTLSTNIELILIIIPLSIYLFILQNNRLLYHHYMLNEFFYLLSSLIISYKCRKIPTRKLSLLFNTLYFVTIVNKNQIPKFFSFELLEEFIIGIFLSISVSLFIFPLFATFDIENRVNYCLYHLQQMYHLVIQAFISEDHITANVLLSRAHIIEKMIRKTMITTQSRFSDTNYEPSRLLQIIFNRKRRFIIDLTIQEQEDLTTSLMLSICSLKLLVKQCSFNKYHYDCVNQLKTSLVNLSSSQSLFISCLIPHSSITRYELLNNLTNLQLSFDTDILREPSRLLQIIFNRKRRFIIDLTIQEQEDLTTSLMLNICSLKLLVQQCSFNKYHYACVNQLKTSLLNLSSSQSLFISCLIPHSSSITRYELLNNLTNLQLSFDTVRSSYIETRLHLIKDTFQSSKIIQSDDHLLHSFFLFQLNSIVRLLTKSILINKNTKINKQKFSFKNYFKFDWSRFVIALKTIIVIGVGSIFVMIPNLAKKKIENGEWILIARCMTQGDTVGGAFTTIKMRLIGTLFGAMWGYVTCLSAGNDLFRTIIMLCPWIFCCGYMKSYPQWGYTVTIAALTPIIVNLGRLPFADSLPAGNYALLRIQQNVIGISIALVLAIIIFPLFAINLLKENIHTALELCRNNVESIVLIYNKVFHHEDNQENLIDFSTLDDIKYYIDNQRRTFHKLINIQRTLVGYASIEPTCWWLNNGFSTSRYKTLVQHQIDIYRMLYHINSSLLRINECSNMDKQQVENLRICASDGLFLPNLYDEILYYI
ncbi:unnamed protein product [Rotaria sp. Silwood2]|nr:unnamed protein product [Rotaria sp. Silwood2]